LLKQSVRETIPEFVIKRKKQGFGVPIAEWIVGNLGEEVERTVNEFLDATDFLDRDAVRRMLAERDPRLWYVFNLAAWWKTYVAEELVLSN
jgi:asparagine synthase (glutamine-hydrolysing)